MTSITVKKLSFAEFLQHCPEDGIYELVNGKFVKVEAIRARKNIARFLMFGLNDEIRCLELDYIVDKDIVIRTMTAKGEECGRNPDVSVVSASLGNATDKVQIIIIKLLWGGHLARPYCTLLHQKVL
jgi:Uma2 family endonuclease